MSNIVQVPASPSNYTVGRLNYKITGIIIHTIVGSLGAADGTFENPARGASAHYGVACDGSACHQYVAESNIAWHCGRFYPDSTHPLANANTIGIEHCDNGLPLAPRSDAEYTCSAQLVREICHRYGIPIDRTHIRKHTEVSVLYTACPDTLDIDRIVRQAAAAPPPPPPPQEDDMLYVSPFHALAASATAFAAGSTYHDPSSTALVEGSLAAGAAVTLVGYRFSGSAVQSSDRGAGAGAGPDYIWWLLSNGFWVSDAILDTSHVTGALIGTAVSTLPAGMTTWFATIDQAGVAGVTLDQVNAAIAAAIAKLPADSDITIDAVNAAIGAAIAKIPAGATLDQVNTAIKAAFAGAKFTFSVSPG